MKLTLIVVTSTLVVLSHSVLADDMSGMKMDATPMKSIDTAQQAQVAKAEGTIKAVDTTEHKVTIAHGAVSALQWPAMTMAFTATSQQMNGLKVGDQVAFEFRTEATGATIVSIKHLK